MDLNFSHADESFRQDVARYFSEAYPKDLLLKTASGEPLTKQDYQRGEQALAAKGWLCVNWLQEHGGTGWSITQKHIFDEELEKAGAINVVPMGVIYVGPVICEFGSSRQQERWLPGIQNSTVFWAQGYSEPGSGSDLASLQCRAVREGDAYHVNGTKIWTSLAQHADWIFSLVRTSKEERKQQGITFLCAPMDSPGISVEPIITIDGKHSLNKVILDDVKIPVDNRIGAEGEGWYIANYLLGNERTSYAHIADKRVQLAAISALSENDPNLSQNQSFQQQLTSLEVRLDSLDLSVLRVLAQTADGSPPGNEASTLKILATELAQDISEVACQAFGYYALPEFGETMPDRQGAKSSMHYFNVRAQTIYGGATEIQKNIIAKRVLGL